MSRFLERWSMRLDVCAVFVGYKYISASTDMSIFWPSPFQSTDSQDHVLFSSSFRNRLQTPTWVLCLSSVQNPSISRTMFYLYPSKIGNLQICVLLSSLKIRLNAYYVWSVCPAYKEASKSHVGLLSSLSLFCLNSTSYAKCAPSLSLQKAKAWTDALLSSEKRFVYKLCAKRQGKSYVCATLLFSLRIRRSPS